MNLSSATTTKSFNSSASNISTSSTKSKEFNSLPLLIQLCIQTDEHSACRTMRLLLLSSKTIYSPNVYDSFGCNLLMYALRYQRYRLFEFLLENSSIDLNFQAKDRYGNTILHYAIIYGGNQTYCLEKLIDKYRKFGLNIDERNYFGYTPLLLAAFCGRFNYILTFLLKTDASPFVRDTIQLKNMFDYLEFDFQSKKTTTIFPSLTPEFKRLIHQFYQTMPYRPRTYIYKNFFEHFFLQSIQDQTNVYRLLICQIFAFESLNNLQIYLNQRYPNILFKSKQISSLPTKTKAQEANSKAHVHQILNLFDPNLKPKAIPLPPITKPPPQAQVSPKRTSIAFKRITTKITTLNAFSKKRPSIAVTRIK